LWSKERQGGAGKGRAKKGETRLRRAGRDKARGYEAFQYGVL